MLVFIIVASLALALLITFLNGMNDAADAVSCIITTQVLSPFKAVAWAAFWGFMAYFIFNSHVAETISRVYESLRRIQRINRSHIVDMDLYVVRTSYLFVTSPDWRHHRTGIVQPRFRSIDIRRSVSGTVIHDIDACHRPCNRIFPSMSYHATV